jgi:hypothetical protein
MASGGRETRSAETRRAETRRLAEYLRRRYPTDVLMPLAAAGKRPCYSHKGGRWTWERYDESTSSARGEREERDVGILLRSLCAVDFDSESVAEEYEASFPELGRAPMERTRQGRHYVFVRPPWVMRRDEEGQHLLRRIASARSVVDGGLQVGVLDGYVGVAGGVVERGRGTAFDED